MKNINVFKNLLLAIISIALFTVSFANAQNVERKGAVSLAPSPSTSTQNVKVVNTSAEPVPVAINGTPTVQVSNSTANPLLVRDVGNAGRHSFSAVISGTWAAGSQVATASSSFTVPFGKRLVIKHASAWVVLPTGQAAYGGLHVNDVAGVTAPFTHYLELSKQISGTVNDVFTAAQPMELYLDFGNEGSLEFVRGSTVGSGLVFLTVSGYMVD